MHISITSSRFNLLLVLICTCSFAQAFNMRQTTNIDGLSNSAILSLSHDTDGLLWIGTCDGINITDGLTLTPFSSYFPEMTLSGNIIELILNAGESKTWVLTNNALDFVDTKNNTVFSYPQFHGHEVLCSNSPDNLFVFAENKHLYYFNAANSYKFQDLGVLDHTPHKVENISLRDDRLWLVDSGGVYTYAFSNLSDGDPLRIVSKKKVIDRKIIFSKSQNNNLFIIDAEGIISEISENGSMENITDISKELKTRGSISNMVRDHHGNFFISFSTDGTLWVGINENGKFETIDLGIKAGVLCLEQSPEQDVMWIGSDCQGLFTYWNDKYSIHSLDFNILDKKITRPIRAIHLDEYKNLWLGTKGDGVLRIKNFNEFYPLTSLNDNQLFTTSNSALEDNAVFTFSKSCRPILWIGSNNGLNYYNYRLDKICTIPHLPREIKFVHDLYEENDSTLWIVSLGHGIIKAHIEGSTENPVITKVKSFYTDNNSLSSNNFLSMTIDRNGNMFFGNRGKGVYELKNDSLCQRTLKRNFGISALNDTFDAIKDGDTLWIGTGNGLIKSLISDDLLFYGTDKGFANNTIHKMLNSPDGDIWLSTNKGMVRFNPTTEEAETYGRNYGLTVTEYSDGASFKTNNSLIFGGIDGITVITNDSNYVVSRPFSPKLSLSRLEIFKHSVPLSKHLNIKNGKYCLSLDYNQNHFTLGFSAPDFINASNYSYFYKFENSGNWINNGPNPTIPFNEIGHGTYNLQVKYINRTTGYESDIYTVAINVKTPWYLSSWANMFYYILLIGFLIGFLCAYHHRQRKKQQEAIERLNHIHKEEVYEEKLKFFTNITHEFCTPLSLIYGPCERILSYSGSDGYIRKYLELIRSNAERLNTLIQELIDFRRIETDHLDLNIQTIDMSELCNKTFNSFSELAISNNIEYINAISPGIVWNSDFSAIQKILNNLISNAFKYTSHGGKIKVTVDVEEHELKIRVYNTGKGIGQEDKARIFNHYCILDNVEENALKGITHRNGLGMAICHSMVKLLNGLIEIESEPGTFAEFIVTLPEIKLSVDQSNTSRSTTSTSITGPVPSHNNVTVSTIKKPSDVTFSASETILVIDDNKDIHTILCDALSSYNVVSALSADEGLQIVRKISPSLIISDIMMPGTDGVDLTRQLKNNRHTMHIPLIHLSAKISNEERINGIESGADAYIGKPFSPSYLQAVVKRLLESRSRLKEYYNSSASAFEYTDGQLLNHEDKEFFETIASFINDHIDDNKLSAEQLALHLNTSVRKLYRKFKELGEVTPNDYIKNQRMAHAAKLLLTTSLTVQEITFDCGFSNRSHFYKEFFKRYGMTPKDYRTANQTKDSSLDDNNRHP